MSNWTYISCRDLETASGCCELCSTRIRYVHKMMHPTLGTIYIGSECASKLIGGADLEEIVRKDKEMRSASSHEKTIKKHYNQYKETMEKHNRPFDSYEDYKAKWLEVERREKNGKNKRS